MSDGLRSLKKTPTTNQTKPILSATSLSLSLSGLRHTTPLFLSLSSIQLLINPVLTVDRAFAFVPQKPLLYFRFFFFFFFNFIRFACWKIL
ncbi:hypothetical protein VNO78_23451 [Psophocarpus tetragonolobus]|uniref:Uncharacterized protein n=1 Tax=Psophocarpus tetragonolobus TaxID=3891 RepID=A0AAN9S6N4_PSOTE